MSITCYQTKSLQDLISSYIHEVDRINQDDKKETQKRIINELRARMAQLIHLLEDEESLKYDLINRTEEEVVESILKWTLKV